MGKLKEFYFEEICRMQEAMEQGFLGEELYEASQDYTPDEVEKCLSELDSEGYIQTPTSEELEAMWSEYEAKIRGNK
jgi:hypothetical protein